MVFTESELRAVGNSDSEEGKGGGGPQIGGVAGGDGDGDGSCAEKWREATRGYFGGHGCNLCKCCVPLVCVQSVSICLVVLCVSGVCAICVYMSGCVVCRETDRGRWRQA